jgi:hypothetical protein
MPTSPGSSTPLPPTAEFNPAVEQFDRELHGDPLQGPSGHQRQPDRPLVGSADTGNGAPGPSHSLSPGHPS